jgi:hypothetical protein
MKKLLHHLFVEESTIFGPHTPSQYTNWEIVTDAVTSPFQLLKWLTKRRGEPRQRHTKMEMPIRNTPPSPTVPQLRAQLDEDIRHVDLLPIEEWEKKEVKAQIQLAFLKKTANIINR